MGKSKNPLELAYDALGQAVDTAVVNPLAPPRPQATPQEINRQRVDFFLNRTRAGAELRKIAEHPEEHPGVSPRWWAIHRATDEKRGMWTDREWLGKVFDSVSEERKRWLEQKAETDPAEALTWLDLLGKAWGGGSEGLLYGIEGLAQAIGDPSGYTEYLRQPPKDILGNLRRAASDKELGGKWGAKWLVYNAVSGLPPTLATLGTGLAAGPGAAFLTYFTTQISNYQREFLADGAEPDEAMTGGFIAALGGACLEQVPLARYTKGFHKLAAKEAGKFGLRKIAAGLGELGFNTLVESVTEGMERVFAEVTKAGVTGKKLDPETLAKAAEESAAAAIMSLIMGIAGGSAGMMQRTANVTRNIWKDADAPSLMGMKKRVGRQRGFAAGPEGKPARGTHEIAKEAKKVEAEAPAEAEVPADTPEAAPRLEPDAVERAMTLSELEGGEPTLEEARRSIEQQGVTLAEVPGQPPGQPPVDIGDTEHEGFVRAFLELQRQEYAKIWEEIEPLGLRGARTRVGRVWNSVTAKIIKAQKLRKADVRVAEALRGLQTAPEVILQEFREFALEHLPETTAAERETILFYGENPKQYARYMTPTMLAHARFQKIVYGALGKELVARKLIGTFPESFINKNLEKIAKLEGGAEELTASGQAKRRKRIALLEQENELLATLNYVRHSVDAKYIEAQLERWGREGSLARKLGSVPKELLGRKHATLDELRQDGIPFEADYLVVMADYVTMAQRRLINHDFHQWVKRQPELALPERNAPDDWAKPYGLKEYAHYKMHPFMLEAILDWTATTSPSSDVGKAMDQTNAFFKQIRFYLLAIMAGNNLQQGLVQGGLKHVLNFPQALNHVIKKTPEYREAQRRGLFAIPRDIPQTGGLQDLRDTLRFLESEEIPGWKHLKKAANLPDGWQAIERFLEPSSRNALLVMNRKATWWLDRAARMSTYLAGLQEGKTTQQAVVDAREAHADYDMMKQEPMKWARRGLLTPAYKAAMWGRLFPKYARHPWRNKRQLARLGAMYFITAALMALKGYAMVEGYRYVKRLAKGEGEEPPEGAGERESVMLAFGPFSELLKVPTRIKEGWRSGTGKGLGMKLKSAFMRTMRNQFAVGPGYVAAVLENRDWKGDQIIKRGYTESQNSRRLAWFTFTYLYPQIEMAEAWRDAKQSTVNKWLRLLAISRYERSTMRAWYERKLKKWQRDLKYGITEQARANPELRAYYTKKAAEDFATRFKMLEGILIHHEDKVRAMRSEKAIDRFLIGVGWQEPPSVAKPLQPRTLGTTGGGRGRTRRRARRYR